MVLFSEMELQMTSQQTHGLNFETIWRNHIMPLAGQTLQSSRGPNKILAVSDAGVRRTTSSGKVGTIPIKVFRDVVERLLKGEVVSRQDVDDAFPERVSSGVCLVLSQVPFFAYEGRPAALRFHPSLIPQQTSAAPTGLLEQALEALSRPGRRADDKEHLKSNGPGLYAIHGAPAVWEQLGLGAPPDGRPLYVGKAEHSLVDRDVKQHFGTGRTGSSTLRRSVAGLLRAHLGSQGAAPQCEQPRALHQLLRR